MDIFQENDSAFSISVDVKYRKNLTFDKLGEETMMYKSDHFKEETPTKQDPRYVKISNFLILLLCNNPFKSV